MVLDNEQQKLWELLVVKDAEAFAACNWSGIEDEFISESFIGIYANNSFSPGDWDYAYPTLDAYKIKWLKQANLLGENDYKIPLEEALQQIITLKKISIKENRACVWKQFDGFLETMTGEKIFLQWQTIYFCTKKESDWKISGFIGHLPLEG
ncbi:MULTISPECIES: hypothetical protein [unclassified Legionella]|uniref:hypothetical protein n=1 Tax=unclassified Legionella TaxID=2622702 RepID=UPI0010569823|nr:MULTISPECIES: hypothetical protein [unclassified Legionella]MDI9818113.1 hypothetical protein [Legionella sp. PL877]